MIINPTKRQADCASDPFAPPKQRRKRERRNPPPTPLWARRSSLIGPEGLIQISETEFFKILASGAIRAHTSGDSQQSMNVFCVQDLLDYIEAHAVRRGPGGTVVADVPEEPQSESTFEANAATIGE